MLELIEGYLTPEEYSLILLTENVIGDMYEYNLHHIELTGLITNLMETNDVNTFYNESLNMYSLLINSIFSTIGVTVVNEMLLVNKVEVLKALIDINNKESSLKIAAYEQLESYDTNLKKLVFILKSLHALEDAVVLMDILSVNDTLIELLEDMLKDDDNDGMREIVIDNILRKVVINTTGVNAVSVLNGLSEYIDASIEDVIDGNMHLLVDTQEDLLNNIIAMITYSSDRNDLINAYLKIKEVLDDEYKDNLNIFAYPMLDKLRGLLMDIGLVNAK